MYIFLSDDQIVNLIQSDIQSEGFQLNHHDKMDLFSHGEVMQVKHSVYLAKCTAYARFTCPIDLYGVH